MNQKRNRYLDLLEHNGIFPNFWCSEEYFDKAGLETDEWHGIVKVFDKNFEGVVFPPMSEREESLVYFPLERIWSDFESQGPLVGYGFKKAFLDLEFIYDPRNFLDMKGGKWATFRKNSRKFLSRNSEHKFFYVPVRECDEIEAQVKDLLIEWLEGRPESQEIMDDMVMVEYILHGDRRKVLIDSSGKVWGINVWDENYRYINFRYCICKEGLFLSEYMRLLFYTDPDILAKKKFVNDGGCLDNENLKRFKLKMNPIKMRKVSGYY